MDKRLLAAGFLSAFIAAIISGAAADKAADGAPVYHVAEIETADGRTMYAVTESASACLAFTRAIALDVAAANCFTFTGAPPYVYIPPKP